MEMFRQNAKSYINYSSEDFMDTTAQDLVHMTPEETICRCHYRMERAGPLHTGGEAVPHATICSGYGT